MGMGLGLGRGRGRIRTLSLIKLNTLKKIIDKSSSAFVLLQSESFSRLLSYPWCSTTWEDVITMSENIIRLLFKCLERMILLSRLMLCLMGLKSVNVTWSDSKIIKLFFRVMLGLYLTHIYLRLNGVFLSKIDNFLLTEFRRNKLSRKQINLFLRWIND